MARPSPLQMFAPSPPRPPGSHPSSNSSSSPNAPTPSSTPAPPPLTTTPSQLSGTSAVPHPTYIQRHFRKRLLNSKAACDAELRKVIHAVTAYVENALRAQQEADWEEEEARERERESALMAAESTSDDAGDESDAEHAGGSVAGRSTGTRKKMPATHRHRRSFILSSGSKVPPMGVASAALAIPGVSATHLQQPAAPPSPSRLSVSSSPAASWGRAAGSSLSRRLSRSSRNYTLSPPLAAGTSPAPSMPASLPFAVNPPGIPLSRESSRSRSRSPLPPATARPRSPAQSPFGSPAQSPGTDPSTPPVASTEPAKPDFISTLRDLITLSQSLLDMPSSALTSPASSHTVSQLVQSVQALGRAWDLQPDWHGRGWYVQVLLAVASLSRVVEWWQAEKEFWHFGEEGEDEDDGEVEGMTFVLKPAETGSGGEDTDKEKDKEKVEETRAKEADRERTVMPEDKQPVATPAATTETEHAQKDMPFGVKPVPRVPPPLDELPHGEVSRAKATEELRALAERAQMEQVIMELGLDGERILWVSPSWAVIVGSMPEDAQGTNITSLLAQTDVHVFMDATRSFQSDDSHTLEARFLLLVRPVPHPPPGEEGSVPPAEHDENAHYVEMEAKGMLVKDRMNVPSHTLWLMRPSPDPSPRAPKPGRMHAPAEDVYPMLPESAETDDPFDSIGQPLRPGAFHARPGADPVTPFPFERPISTTLILCRICECQVPDWFFEKHSETCNEVHRLEADITECDESMQELMRTIAQMSAALDRQGQSSPVPGPGGSQLAAAREAPPEYRGVPVFTPASAPASPIQSGALRTSASARLQRVAVRKLQRRLLDNLAEILQQAREIEMPAVNEDAPLVPLERQPFLTPASETRVALVSRWQPPPTDDSALARLVQDAETLMRTKVEYVNRMRNTLMYSEKVRHEWEDKVEQTLQEMENEGAIEDDSDSGESGKSVNDNEIAALQPTERPTPMAPSPVPFEPPHSSLLSNLRAPAPSSALFAAGPTMSPSPPTSSSSFSSPHVLPSSSSPHAYSPHASSPVVPSPLAFTTPILPRRRSDDPVPAGAAVPAGPSSILQMTLGTAQAQPIPQPTLHSRRSVHNVIPEPRLVVTPPLSPMVSPKDAALGVSTSQSLHSVHSHSRRPSAAQPFSPLVLTAPLSPRIPSIAPASKTSASSIRDFEIIKPISKGAFGSVYLAKKKTTGDYYAIKVLKKADMIAKNQVTNVKAERTILMQQADSPFVVKLYFTFQNKDYLYLVMEYLNGGDCAALIKTIGALPEDWARTYVAEVILGLENIHARGIVHRDLKPDNLLIDSRGHLKLTDFGLSRIGLFGRQARDGRSFAHRRGSQAARAHAPRSGFPSRQPSVDATSALSSSSDATLDTSTFGTSYFSQRGTSSSHLANTGDDVSESSGSESISGLFHPRTSLATSDSPQQSFASELTSDLRAFSLLGGGTPPVMGSGTPPSEQKFVGTPDYLAPETILATSEDDRAVDWWALGVITYEFLYGFPPFHADTPAQVFDNIISRRIEWYEQHVDFSKEAHDFMDRLLCTDPIKRLGSKGAEEVKAHPFVRSIEWDKLTAKPAQFVPQITDPESTDYFDPRGAIPQLFQDDDSGDVGAPSTNSSPKAEKLSLRPGSTHPSDDAALSPALNDFGSFSFKNLPVLKQANDDVIRKLKAESPGPMHGRRNSLSQRLKNRQSIVTTFDPRVGTTNPPSPSTSTSSIASTPSRGSFPSWTPGGSVSGHGRRPSEHGVLDRFKTQFEEGVRRNSMPSRLRTASVSSSGDQASGLDSWQGPGLDVGTPASSVGSAEMKKPSEPESDRTVVCLLAEDNIISQKVQEVILTRMGCRCVLVSDGAEAVLAACGEIKFDCILMDYQMPIMDGEIATKFIKSTNNKNTSTPVIAVSAYTAQEPGANSNLFQASLSKPVQRNDVLAVMRKLGFKISNHEGGGSKHPHKVVAK